MHLPACQIFSNTVMSWFQLQPVLRTHPCESSPNHRSQVGQKKTIIKRPVSNNQNFFSHANSTHPSCIVKKSIQAGHKMEF